MGYKYEMHLHTSEISFCASAAAEAAKSTGMDVFFAWEYSIGGGSDFLVYGLGPEWPFCEQTPAL